MKHEDKIKILTKIQKDAETFKDMSEFITEKYSEDEILMLQLNLIETLQQIFEKNTLGHQICQIIIDGVNEHDIKKVDRGFDMMSALIDITNNKDIS